LIQRKSLLILSIQRLHHSFTQLLQQLIQLPQLLELSQLAQLLELSQLAQLLELNPLPQLLVLNQQPQLLAQVQVQVQAQAQAQSQPPQLPVLKPQPSQPLSSQLKLAASLTQW